MPFDLAISDLGPYSTEIKLCDHMYKDVGYKITVHSKQLETI